jgi:hypothetical protein
LGIEEGEVTILLNFEDQCVLLDNIQFEEKASGAASPKSKIRELWNERRVSLDNYGTFLKTSS